MNELKGSEFLLQIRDPDVELATDANAYVTVGGLKTKSLSLNGEAVDVTNHGSNGWRQLLNGVGINSIDVSGEGVTEKTDTLKLILEAWKHKRHIDMRMQQKFGDEDVLQIDMAVQIVTIELSGENDKEVPYSLSFNSAEEPDMKIF